jgi:mono/diheme cytochrome c family protein
MRLTIDLMRKMIALAALATIAAAAASGSPGIPGAPADGASTYKAKCASCHGANGSGQTPAGKALNLRDLRSAEVQGMNDAKLYQVIAKGKSKMPGYEKTLGADTCKALVAFIRQLK